MIKQTAALAMALILLAGCSIQNSSKSISELNATPRDLYQLPESPVLLDIVKQLAAQLEVSSRYVDKTTAIAITSFVELTDLRQTDQLGNQLSEMMLVEMQQRGWTLIDFKLTGDIDVTPAGDLALSRDFMRLQHSHAIDYLLTGTMTSTQQGIHVTARIVGLESRAVVASAQTLIPTTVLARRQGQTTTGGFISRNHDTGMIMRKGS